MQQYVNSLIKLNFKPEHANKVREGRAGFTLIELMIVVLIATLILLGIFGILTIGRRSWQLGTTQVDVQQEARKAMDAMLSELREASAIDPSSFVGGVSTDIIQFDDLSGAALQFALSANQLQRTAPGPVTTVLANHIATMEFTMVGTDELHISLTAQKNTVFGHLVETTLSSQVLLRN